MKRAKVLFIAAGVVFGLWTAWLAYEAATTTNVIIVSRPQLLMAPIVVEAEVPVGPAGEREVIVKHIYRWEKPPTWDKVAPRKVLVSDLGGARGWRGPGAYILALQGGPDEQTQPYRLVPVPISPGFRPQPDSELAKPPMYPATDSTRYQVRAILGPGEPAN
jgi:hypothetical protein